MKFGRTRRTFVFTVEKQETYTIQRSAKVVLQWCAVCESEVKMSNPETAAQITGQTTRKIYLGIENGKTHFTESAEGALMLCLRSVSEKLRCRKL